MNLQILFFGVLLFETLNCEIYFCGLLINNVVALLLNFMFMIKLVAHQWSHLANKLAAVNEQYEFSFHET